MHLLFYPTPLNSARFLEIPCLYTPCMQLCSSLQCDSYITKDRPILNSYYVYSSSSSLQSQNLPAYLTQAHQQDSHKLLQIHDSSYMLCLYMYIPYYMYIYIWEECLDDTVYMCMCMCMCMYTCSRSEWHNDTAIVPISTYQSPRVEMLWNQVERCKHSTVFTCTKP